MDWNAWLDPAFRAMDYTSGVGRYAAAGLANIPYAAATGQSVTKPEDLENVLVGQGPSASEYLQRTGASQGSPWVDMGADIALDPTTYMTGGAKIPVAMAMGAVGKGFKVDAVGKLGQVVGSKVFKEKPTFRQVSNWLNKQAEKYGAHPGLVKHYDEATGEVVEKALPPKALPYDKTPK